MVAWSSPVPRQNWVLTPVQDLLLIIAAPVISLALALLAIRSYGAERGAALIITAHIVLTVAHHLPTFIRIYGDVELFRRYKWSFLLGPVVPLAFVSAMLVYINLNGHPLEHVLYLYIFLALWDPWHFLRQHFGFTRIYDRNNNAPVALASGMDWWLCTAWFVHIMVASGAWIPGLLEDLYRSANIPLVFAVPPGLPEAARGVTGVATAAMTVIYAGYLFWCRSRGYFVSPAKLALLLCTFGVMYLTYTPNDLILQLAPAWGFKVGFATLGIVHMTQYLAIVWRYDQRLAQQGRARRGWFAWLHSRRTRWGMLFAALAYALFCVAYGDAVTSAHENRWLMSALLAVGFTSTLLHYYFDGFMWRVRHQQNREALGLQQPDPARAPPGAAGLSWWTTTPVLGMPQVLLRQLLYFGLPLGLLTIGALQVWSTDRTSYVQYMYAAQRLSQEGDHPAANAAARQAHRRMLADLPYLRRMAALQPTSVREAELAFLIYNEALYTHRVLPALDGRTVGRAGLEAFAGKSAEAAQLLAGAISRGGSLAHAGREQLDIDEARRIAASWSHQHF